MISQVYVIRNHIFLFRLILSGRKGYPCFTLDPGGCMSSSKAREHPELKKETLRFLRKQFTPILRTFEEQTGMKIKLS